MAIPATSTATRTASAAPAPAGATPSPRGVGDTPSSISTPPAAAAAPADPGCWARMCGWVTSIWESIRGCLANLPLIGSWFAPAAAFPPGDGTTAPGSTGSRVAPSAPGSTAPAGTAPVVVAPTDADIARVHRIQGVFFTAEEVTAGASNALPEVILLQLAMSQFRGITTPIAKMEAFRHVMHAGNVTDAVVRDYYNALPRPLQNAFKGEMHAVNNNSATFGGRDHGMGFGDHMVNHAIRHQVAKTAAANLHDQMIAELDDDMTV
jgi:hypothetical protein